MRPLESLITQSKLLSSLPGLRHGFTNSLTPPAEAEALEAATASAKQVHRAELIWVNALEKRVREADAVATLQPNMPVGVHSADCTPILVAALDPSTKKIYAAMAVHAGWRGTALGIAEKTFLAFAGQAQNAAGVSLHFVAAIGPCIGFESFEVGQDVIDAFPGAEQRGQARFLRMEGEHRKYLFDLPGENQRQLQNAAAKLNAPLEVEILGLCTFRLEKEFPSYRRNREKAGRILSFLSFTG